MKFCNNCGHEVQEDELFCSECGNKLEVSKQNTSESEENTSQNTEEMRNSDKSKPEAYIPNDLSNIYASQEKIFEAQEKMAENALQLSDDDKADDKYNTKVIGEDAFIQQSLKNQRKEKRKLNNKQKVLIILTVVILIFVCILGGYNIYISNINNSFSNFSTYWQPLP